MKNTNKNKVFTDKIKIKRALISVTKKKDIERIAKVLVENNVEILSTGGTAKFLEEKLIPVRQIADYTNFPEILNGRVKTLHPNIYGGILSRRNDSDHINEIKKNKIQNIDLLIINLYEFDQVSKNTNDVSKIIENIDIGGPAMIRAGAKNFEFVTVVTEIEDYPQLINEINENTCTTYKFRKYLAEKAFNLTNEYDFSISSWFKNKNIGNLELPQKISINLNKSLPMRYGENPHQRAAFYEFSNIKNRNDIFKKIQGKELSYNNINDVNSAYELIREFEMPAVAIIKHANPCGVAENTNINLAWKNALQTDPISSFGGIVAINRELDQKLANKMKSLFLEVIIAPKISLEAQIVFKNKPNVRLIQTGKVLSKTDTGLLMKSIRGGMLVQTHDDNIIKKEDLEIVTKKLPTKKQIEDLLFAWKVVKHTKSNAIVYAKDLKTVGIGAGQMSRIDSTNIAKEKAKISAKLSNLIELPTIGSVVASDAFFPFPDSLISAAEAGVTAIIQPGGSIRDQEVINAANERDLVMVFTSIRHFKH